MSYFNIVAHQQKVQLLQNMKQLKVDLVNINLRQH